MPAIYVALRPETYEALRRLAAQERRRPHDQAAIFVERGLDAACAARDDRAVDPDRSGSESNG